MKNETEFGHSREALERLQEMQIYLMNTLNQALPTGYLIFNLTIVSVCCLTGTIKRRGVERNFSFPPMLDMPWGDCRELMKDYILRLFLQLEEEYLRMCINGYEEDNRR